MTLATFARQERAIAQKGHRPHVNELLSNVLLEQDSSNVMHQLWKERINLENTGKKLLTWLCKTVLGMFDGEER